jgi:hypothetical protein
MTNRTLSPAAQAVLTAQAKERCLFEWSTVNDPPCHPSDSEWNGCIQCVDRRGIAAALRAAANQLTHATSAHTLYAFADELEGNKD